MASTASPAHHIPFLSLVSCTKLFQGLQHAQASCRPWPVPPHLHSMCHVLARSLLWPLHDSRPGQQVASKATWIEDIPMRECSPDAPCKCKGQSHQSSYSPLCSLQQSLCRHSQSGPWSPSCPWPACPPEKCLLGRWAHRRTRGQSGGYTRSRGPATSPAQRSIAGEPG